mgnify:FL=1
MWRYNSKMLSQFLEADDEYKKIIDHRSNIVCPYDGIHFYSESMITHKFQSIIDPAGYWQPNYKQGKLFYNHFISLPLFRIQWEKRFVDIPSVIIRINPDKNNLTPLQVLDLLKYLVGDLRQVRVAKWDEKVDTDKYNVDEVLERLYKGYQRVKPNDYDDLGETFYFGKRNGQQVKVYDKSNEQGFGEGQLTRIEKTRVLGKGKRPTATQFLLNMRHDLFKHVNLLDIEKLDGRSKIMRLLKQDGVFMDAFRKLTRAEKLRVKREDAFKNPSIDLRSIAEGQLRKWLNKTPLLSIKAIMYSIHGQPYNFHSRFSGALHVVSSIPNSVLQKINVELNQNTTSNNFEGDLFVVS